MVLSDKALYPVLVLNSIRSQNLKIIKLRTEYKTSTKAEINNVICTLFFIKISTCYKANLCTRENKMSINFEQRSNTKTCPNVRPGHVNDNSWVTTSVNRGTLARQ